MWLNTTTLDVVLARKFIKSCDCKENKEFREEIGQFCMSLLLES